ncbi:MAG: diaminobutyrate acetyltransferase [Methylobacter sp.]|jgi:diaminobutyrate acetyltransferase|uniref:L-2,4-diaminobutyric acid acetyltransferase n=2 Tax=Methylococcaceae TaxID=403 RepID=B2CKR5_METMR|nr:L-2,4-diaminobutyric acid acetyltransferase [Methylobacter marinus]MCL7423146.1 diaminobutyrate acetyltransferase [Methylobacter sp.]
MTDGPSMQALVEASPPLDNNSRYCYLLLCEYFADTCAVVEADGEILAFVTAYVPPGKPDTLAVWQVAVASSLRGQGVARQLIDHVLRRPGLEHIRFVEATVNPSNDASRALFASLAKACETTMSEACIFPKTLFPSGHEQENLLRVGPFQIHTAIQEQS